MNLEDLLSGQSGGSTDSPDQSPLKSLKVDLDFYKEAIKEVSEDIIGNEISQYPIFIAHQHEVSIGETILDRNELNTQWTIQASTLEEFIEKGIVKDDRKAFFEKQFKPASEFMCLFVIVPEGANFVFYPY